MQLERRAAPPLAALDTVLRIVTEIPAAILVLVEVGILADVIVGVQTVPLAQIQPSLSTLSGIRKEFLKGVTAGGLVILDADKIVACDSILVHEDV